MPKLIHSTGILVKLLETIVDRQFDNFSLRSHRRLTLQYEKPRGHLYSVPSNCRELIFREHLTNADPQNSFING